MKTDSELQSGLGKIQDGWAGKGGPYNPFPAADAVQQESPELARAAGAELAGLLEAMQAWGITSLLGVHAGTTVDEAFLRLLNVSGCEEIAVGIAPAGVKLTAGQLDSLRLRILAFVEGCRETLKTKGSSPKPRKPKPIRCPECRGYDWEVANMDESSAQWFCRACGFVGDMVWRRP
jgi:hypothetical protein